MSYCSTNLGLLLWITTVQTSLVVSCASLFTKDWCETCARKLFTLAAAMKGLHCKFKCCSANLKLSLSWKSEVSWFSKCTHRQPKIVCESRVAITILLLSQNGLRSNLRASNFPKKIPEDAPPTPPPSLIPGYRPANLLHIFILLMYSSTA